MNKGVATLCYFSKPRGVREKRRLKNTGLEGRLLLLVYGFAGIFRLGWNKKIVIATNLFSLALQPISVLGCLGLRFLDYILLDTHARARARTHTHGRTHVIEWSARRRGRYVHNTQRTQETNIRALSGIRTHDPSNQSATELRLRQHCYWN